MVALTPPFVLLEDRLRPDVPARLFRSPRRIIRCARLLDLEAAWDELERGLDQGLHAAGFLSYEAGAGFEPRLRTPSVLPPLEPLAWFGLFERAESIPSEELDALLADMAPAAPILNLAPHHSLTDHVARVEAAQALIGAGDIYQVNLTYPIDFQYSGDPVALYAALRVRQPVAHGGIVALGDHTVLSISPELFIARDGDRLSARPMKGTAPRGDDRLADEQLRLGLRADPKQRAENLMITDLLRNDLSRVCAPGSVRTPSLFTIETYPSFHALTSTVTGQVRPTVRLAQIFEALFPCGSIIGAPKIRAAEIIAELEDRPRGVYTGAIGAISPDGNLAFNVAIRTAVIAADGRGRYGVGGGIVADSDPADEYAEAQLKARPLTELAEDYQLIETLLWSPHEGFVRLEGHLSRLGGSAARLGFKLAPGALRDRLAKSARAWRDGQPRRVRILLHRSGRVDIAAEPYVPEPQRPLRLGLFGDRLDGAEPFLRHKTTRRQTHEAAASAAAARNLDEMILLNRHDRVADGARNTVFLRKDGLLLTPPLREGALAGVLRQALIDAGQVCEASIAAADLTRYPLLIGNSLRGLREAVLSNAAFG